MAFACSIVSSTVAVIAVLAVMETTAGASAEQVVLRLNAVKSFECQETAHTLLWYYGGIPSDHLNNPDVTAEPAESLGNGILKQNLIVTATLAVNNSVITCNTVQGLLVVTIREIHITIQGYLKSPEALNVHAMSDSSVRLQWEAPFTLNITDVEPDIKHYTIQISSTHTDETMKVNVTAMQYVFVGEQCMDAAYTFSITAWNVAGEGEIGTFPGHYPLKGYPKAPEALNVQTLNDSSVKLQWETPCTLDIADVEPDITHYIIYISSTHNDEIMEVNVTAMEYVFVGEQCIDATYTFSITAWNIAREGDMGTFPEQYPLKETYSSSDKWTLEELLISVSLTEQTVKVDCSFDISSNCLIRPLPDVCTVEVTPSSGRTETFYTTLDNEQPHQRVPMNEFIVQSSSSISDCRVVGDYTDNDTEDQNTELIAPVVIISCGCILTAIAIIVVMMTVLVRRKRSKQEPGTGGPGEPALTAMKSNLAYETVTSRASVTQHELQPCPAYGIARRQL